MTAREVATLAIGITGFVCIAYSFQLLQGLTSAVAWLGSGERFVNAFQVLAIIVPYLLLLGFGVFLVGRRENLARIWFPPEQTRTSAITAEDLRSIGYSIAGVMLLGFAVPSLLKVGSNVSLIFFSSQEELSLFESQKLEFLRFVRNSWAFAIGTLVQVGIGIYLVVLGKSGRPLLNTSSQPDAEQESELSCPQCGHSYRIADYDPDAKVILCSKCKHELPKCTA